MRRLHPQFQPSIGKLGLQCVVGVGLLNAGHRVALRVAKDGVAALQRGQRTQGIQRPGEAGEMRRAMFQAAHADGLQAQARVLGVESVAGAARGLRPPDTPLSRVDARSKSTPRVPQALTATVDARPEPGLPPAARAAQRTTEKGDHEQ